MRSFFIEQELSRINWGQLLFASASSADKLAVAADCRAKAGFVRVKIASSFKNFAASRAGLQIDANILGIGETPQQTGVLNAADVDIPKGGAVFFDDNQLR